MKDDDLGWNEQLIQTIFRREDVDLILKMS